MRGEVADLEGCVGGSGAVGYGFVGCYGGCGAAVFVDGYVGDYGAEGCDGEGFGDGGGVF